MQRLCTLGVSRQGLGWGSAAFCKHQELYQAPPKYEHLFRSSKWGTLYSFHYTKRKTEAPLTLPQSLQILNTVQTDVGAKPPLPRSRAVKASRELPRGGWAVLFESCSRNQPPL